MRFYPITYHSYEDKKGAGVIIWAVEHTGNKEKPYRRVSLKFRYTYWFYASLQHHTYAQVRAILSPLSGVYLDAPAVGRPESDVIQRRSSTIDPHNVVPVVRVHAESTSAKQEAMRILNNNQVKMHEYDGVLLPVLKMLAEKDVVKYQWMEVDAQMSASQSTTWRQEYACDTMSLRSCSEALAPPPFSYLSYDIETDCENTNKMPDAKQSMVNAIRVLNLTYVDPMVGRYEEHAIVYGMDVSDVYRKYTPTDFVDRMLQEKDGMTNMGPIVRIHTVHDELDGILKFFDLIRELDPCIITGHNIISFDNSYILERYRLLVMQRMKKGSGATMRLPNISRLREHVVSANAVEWNNSQVAISGMYFDTPGRVWVDTLIVASRGLLGQMRNKKLDTIAEVHLGMHKNDVSYKDMFVTFRLTRDLELVYKILLQKPDDKEALERKSAILNTITSLYRTMVSKHNKDIPDDVQNPTITHINKVISTMNSMNQRGTKKKLYVQKDAIKLNLREIYNAVRNECAEMISKWNIPTDVTDPTEQLKVMWWLVVMYCMQDTRIPYQVLIQQNIIPVLCEQSSVFSVDIADVCLKGQIHTVTCSQYKYNYNGAMMVDFGNPGGPTGKYEYDGGFVGKGQPGLKITDNDTVITTLDFASLYPTIIIAHNICYTTWVEPAMRDPYTKNGDINPDYIWLKYEETVYSNRDTYEKELENLQSPDPHIKDERDRKDRIDTLQTYLTELYAIVEAPYEEKGTKMCHIFNVPNSHTKQTNTHWFLRASVKEGILPGMLWQQYKARKAIKKLMDAAKAAGNMIMYVTYNAQQLAVKVSMNASYGALGTASNRLACYPAAETITYIGRMAILKCNDWIEKNNPDDDVVYNDTDSGFVRLKNITKRFNRNIKAIKEYGEGLAASLAKLFPKPMGMEMENVFISLFLKAPKMYAGIKCDGQSLDIEHYTWDYINTMNLLYVKGLAPVRNDKYKYNKELFNRILYMTLVRANVMQLIYTLEKGIQTIWNLRNGFKNVAVVNEMFAYNMGVTPTALGGGDGTMSKWISIYEQKYKKKPAAGEKFELLVTNVSSGPDANKHTKAPSKLVTMEWLQEENRTLDVQHYIEVLGNKGNVIEIMHIAYPEDVQMNCIKQWYLPKLRSNGKVRD